MSKEGISTSAGAASSLHDGAALSPEEFTSKYPYLLRYCQPSQLTEDKFVLEPQPGESASYGVFFYPLSEPKEIESSDRPKLLVKTMDLIDNIDSVRQTFMRGVLVIPSVFHGTLAERTYRQVLEVLKSPIKSGFEAESSIYHDWPVLNEKKANLGMQPVFSVPVRMEIRREYSLLSTRHG